MLGQEQDQVGGGFNKRESFIGEMSQLVILNYTLSEQEVQHLATSVNGSCSHTEGTVLSWTDVAMNVKGNATIRKHSWCMGEFYCLNGVIYNLYYFSFRLLDLLYSQ